MSRAHYVKLPDYLSNLDPHEIVAIGALHGSAYVYFGEAGDTKKIEECFNKHLENIKACRDRNERKMIRLVTNSTALPVDPDEKLKTIYHIAEEIAKSRNALAACERAINSFKPIMERYVVRVHYKDTDECRAILVTGVEQGDFWMKKEFDKSR